MSDIELIDNEIRLRTAKKRALKFKAILCECGKPYFTFDEFEKHVLVEHFGV